MVSAVSLRAGATTLILACALCAHVVATAQQVSIETSGQGELITVTASADMQVDPRTAWNVISDYDHLAEFIPYMHSSRVIQRDGDTLLVEQTGEIALLFFQQPVEVKLAVVESPPRRIVARAVGGNLKEMEGRYALETLSTGEVRLSYSGRLVPEFPVPPIIGKMAVRSVLAKQFTALVNEIHRRDGLARGAREPR
ncbi:SRPBCC family protein [Variovorax paradoxus]|nr:SRPBCC family protein [Variovorax paradoxus]